MASAQAQDSWDAIYINGGKTGWVHTFVKKVQEGGRDYLNVRVDIEQKVKRDNDFSVTKLMYGTIETLDGQVLKLDTLIKAGDQKLRARRRDPRRNGVGAGGNWRTSKTEDSVGP